MFEEVDRSATIGMAHRDAGGDPPAAWICEHIDGTTAVAAIDDDVRLREGKAAVRELIDALTKERPCVGRAENPQLVPDG